MFVCQGAKSTTPILPFPLHRGAGRHHFFSLFTYYQRTLVVRLFKGRHIEIRAIVDDVIPPAYADHYCHARTGVWRWGRGNVPDDVEFSRQRAVELIRRESLLRQHNNLPLPITFHIAINSIMVDAPDTPSCVDTICTTFDKH